ncbi:DEAD/DEAH box helicase family protein [Pseudoalteromonas sp. B5MOD-1]|uniref:DEAD/DEAH box helicase family protein n=1 Tax=Pseudoalteromonas sp. P80D2 TaxID=3113903 RepID=UPI002FC7FD8B
MNFKDILFPENYEYSSDSNDLPLEFYLSVLPKSKAIYLKLGYFSSSAIRVLAYGFAQFIYNGGAMKIVTNHFLYGSDKKLLDGSDVSTNELDKEFILSLRRLKESLTSESEQFYNCVRYLIHNNRLEIIPVMLLPNKMAHYKQGVFIDEEQNSIFMDGSCNFTANGLLENGENISVYRSWGEDFEQRKVTNKTKDVLSICEKQSSQYKYLDRSEILDTIASLGKEKSIDELLKSEAELVNSYVNKTNSKVINKCKLEIEKLIEIEKNEPKFPYNSNPREYQQEAYSNWIDNNCKGVFSMATGTGKTITSLNCLLNMYKVHGCYQAVILVPGKTLLKQWVEEVNSFNFKNIIPASSDFPKWKVQLNELITSLLFDKQKSFVLITTYATFTNDKFQKLFKKLPKQALLIADEAHNLGSPQIKKIIKNLHIEKRIALSATLTRQFDDEGNRIIEETFDSTYPYTYNFSMKKAIDEGVLCQYDYLPHFVYLEEDELEAYVEISRQLLKFFDFDKGTFKTTDMVQRLLIQRKTIIHKASGKLSVFKKILTAHFEEYSSVSNSFVYVPEGDDGENQNILDKFLTEYEALFPNNRAYAYTSETDNREKVLELFDKGFVDTLFSMKCLDEGVDVPRTELAIFCSSTGNPRQFIQRRGRVLRSHPNKARAVIHDMVVIPSIAPNDETKAIERKLLRDELIRVVYFASLARNYYSTMNKFTNVAESYDIDLYGIQEAIEDKQ